MAKKKKKLRIDYFPSALQLPRYRLEQRFSTDGKFARSPARSSCNMTDVTRHPRSYDRAAIMFTRIKRKSL